MVSLSKAKPTGCPANMGAIANTRATVSRCDQSGGYAELLLNVNEDMCTSERSTLYLWVQVKGASQVSQQPASRFRVWGLGSKGSGRCACGSSSRAQARWGGASSRRCSW